MVAHDSIRVTFDKLKEKPWFKLVIALLVFALGIVFGWLITTQILEKPVKIVPIHDSNTGYNFINPTLYTDSPQELSFPTFTPLKNALTQYFTTATATNKVTQIGLYYRDLNSSDWVGINQGQQFDPASMMKVVTLIALLRLSETQPEVTAVKISIPASFTIPTTGTQDYYPPSDPIKSGNSYTISDLMQRLIVQSDNGADAVLIEYLGNQSMQTVYSDLRLPLPGTSTGISPQNYSHLFRSLYNATYLSSSDSENALKLLSRSDFTAGLVAGVPSGTIVAHKFGESMDGTPGLNDCGIVYYPNHPYFLCVMTKGSDFNTLAEVIKDISNITWQQVSLLKNTNNQ